MTSLGACWLEWLLVERCSCYSADYSSLVCLHGVIDYYLSTFMFVMLTLHPFLQVPSLLVDENSNAGVDGYLIFVCTYKVLVLEACLLLVYSLHHNIDRYRIGFHCNGSTDSIGVQFYSKVLITSSLYIQYCIHYICLIVSIINTSLVHTSSLSYLSHFVHINSVKV